MKRIITILALVFMLSLALTRAPSVQASFGFEDPQLCVDGQLLIVEPADAANVFVSVPADTTVDYNVADCGGDETQPVVPSENVSFDGNNQMEVVAWVAPHTDVSFRYAGTNQARRSGKDTVKARFKLP